jgi:hypothetical protein
MLLGPSPIVVRLLLRHCSLTSMCLQVQNSQVAHCFGHYNTRNTAARKILNRFLCAVSTSKHRPTRAQGQACTTGTCSMDSGKPARLEDCYSTATGRYCWVFSSCTPRSSQPPAPPQLVLPIGLRSSQYQPTSRPFPSAAKL